MIACAPAHSPVKLELILGIEPSQKGTQPSLRACADQHTLVPILGLEPRRPTGPPLLKRVRLPFRQTGIYSWYERGDLNPYSLSGTTLSRWCVCRFATLAYSGARPRD